MLIVCPNCATSYEVDVANLRPGGRRVRCVRCRTVWDAELPRAEKLVAAAEALAPQSAEVAPENATAGAIPTAEAPAAQAEVGARAETYRPAGETPADPPPDAPPPDAVAAAALLAGAGDSAVEVESPPLAPADQGADGPATEAEAQAGAAAAPLEDIESVAARHYPHRPKPGGWRWPLSRLQSGILALIVCDAIVVGWRTDFVRAMPQTASFYAWIGLPVNLRGLNFENLATATEQHEGLPILAIGGDIVNLTGKSEDVPHLRFAVRNAARQEIYSWTAAPPRAVLAPGEGVVFHTRLASPPPDAHDVLVRFVNRYDIMTGTR